MLTRQKEQEGEANVTTILFDHEVQLLHDRFPLHAVVPLTEKDYYVRGCTALLDAIGYGVEKMVNIQRHLPEDERAEKVIFVITTDGLENASKRFSYEKIRRMIEREKEQYGWEFLFLGANMDAVKEAARFGISSDRAVRFENDAQGVAVNYHVVSETVSRMREAPCCASIGAEWKEQIEADFQKLSPGGAISYIEVPNMQNNIPAVLSVMQYIYNNIMYAELNTKSDYCECCGYDGEIQIKEDENGKLIWECPNCGNTDQDHMFVARRTCGYIGTQFWNQGRTQEIKDRVLHL